MKRRPNPSAPSLDALRAQASALENALIDDLLGHRIGRRAFLRQAGVLGFAAALPVGLAPRRACASEAAALPALTVGMTVPSGAIDPLTVADTGGVCMLSQVGEYLAVSDPDLQLRPCLAQSWQPNRDGSVWTFQLRRGIRFHDGRMLTSADVVATMERLADPANGSVALSAFAGSLSKGGTRAADDMTVEFHLDAPNGSFPYLVSSDNYNAIVLPASYDGKSSQCLQSRADVCVI